MCEDTVFGKSFAVRWGEKDRRIRNTCKMEKEWDKGKRTYQKRPIMGKIILMGRKRIQEEKGGGPAPNRVQRVDEGENG